MVGECYEHDHWELICRDFQFGHLNQSSSVRSSIVAHIYQWEIEHCKIKNCIICTQNKIQFEIKWEYTFVRYILGEKDMLPTWYTNIELPLGRLTLTGLIL